MSSSISNSKSEDSVMNSAETQAFETGYIASQQRRIYLKISLSLLLVMTAAMGAVRLFTYLNNASAEGIMGRVVEARQALPQIVEEEKDLVMMFGSSMVGAGFSPRQFDREVGELGKQVKSFNFGFGGLNPFFQDYLSRRIKEAFQAKDRNMKLVIIEFNPFQASQTRWNGAIPIVDSFLTMLATDKELLEIALDDPERGALLFNIKYLRNDISAEMVTSFFGRGMFPGKRAERFDEPDELHERRRELGRELTELFEKEYPDYVDARWDYDWQGGGTIPEERSERTLQVFKEYYETFQHDTMKKNRRLSRNENSGIEALHFEPLLVESFIRIVENFKPIAERVEIVMMPRDTKWIKYTPEAQARLDQAVQQIESATGLKIHNHQLLEKITPDMYRDVTHLTKYAGDVTYTRHLVEEFGGRL